MNGFVLQLSVYYNLTLLLLFRLLENRIARLQDDLETSNLKDGMAIMMSSKSTNKKPKDPNKPVSMIIITAK